jgi:hypothetical protein
LWIRNQPQPRGTHRQHDIIDALIRLHRQHEVDAAFVSYRWRGN